MLMKITNEDVLNALSHVEEPDLKKDLVTLKMVEDVKVDGLNIAFTIILTTPACPLKDMIRNACVNAVKHFVHKDAIVEVHMTSRVTTNSSPKLNNIKNIILVSSGKGGVGKSTIAVNLALALKAKGAQVGLLDADISGPSVPIMLDVENAKPKAFKEGEKTRMFPVEQYGIKVLSIGFFTQPGQPIPWRGPMASTAVKQLFNDADWGELDYLVVDMPPGTGDIHITIAQGYNISGAVIVTTPQKVALADTAKGIGMFKMSSINVPVLGIVENMAYFTPKELPDNKYYIFGKNGAKLLSEQFDAPILAQIPLTLGLAEYGDSGKPVMLEEENDLKETFLHLAEKVAQQIAIHNAQSIQKELVN
jgi:ATP-binding protein involved in chromosome partitioning